MKTGSKFRLHLLLPIIVLGSMLAAAQDFTYTTNNGTITITGYTGTDGAVVIPDTITGLPVTSIGDAAFRFSGISSAVVPDSVTNIGFQAFAYCQNLTSIEVGAFNQIYSTEDGVLFDKLQTTLIQCPSGKTGVYSIPNGVTTIAEWAFASCNNLTSLTLPNSVTGIPPHGMYECGGLTNVSIPNSVNSIGDQAFIDCSSLTSIRLPNSVTSIGFDTFDGCGLTDVTIPDTVTSMGPMVFESCGNLARVTLPRGITHIADQMFESCTSLTNVIIPASVSEIGYAVFWGCPNLSGVYFEGNAPALAGEVFDYFSGTPPAELWDPVTVYYLPGTTGWGSSFDERPTAPWTLPYPLMLDGNNSSPTFGVQTNQFTFTVSWATNASVVVEAATDLANSVWSPVATNALTGGSFYFSDPQWTNYSSRFYRVRSQ